MELWSILVWLFINVAIPLLAPIALLPLLGAGRRYQGKVKKLVIRSLKEGQLFWTVIAMCAAACYEAAVHLDQLTRTPDEMKSGHVIGWIAIGWHVAVIVASAVLVLLGTMDAFDEETLGTAPPAQAPNEDISTIMATSIWISIITAVTLTATHIWAN